MHHTPLWIMVMPDSGTVPISQSVSQSVSQSNSAPKRLELNRCPAQRRIARYSIIILSCSSSLGCLWGGTGVCDVVPCLVYRLGQSARPADAVCDHVGCFGSIRVRHLSSTCCSLSGVDDHGLGVVVPCARGTICICQGVHCLWYQHHPTWRHVVQHQLSSCVCRTR